MKTPSSTYPFRSSRALALVVLSLVLCGVYAMGQTVRPPRRSTPVDTDDKKPRTVLHYYDKHGNPLPEPVRFLAVLDTVKVPKSKPVFATFSGVSASVAANDVLALIRTNPIMDLSASADISLWNWIFPTIEVGAASGLKQPVGERKVNFSPYVKLGLDYNFLYKSNPDYRLFLGFRGAYTMANYDGYTSADADKPLSLAPQTIHALFGDIVGGIRVMITDHFSLGWNLRCHVKFKSFDTADFSPNYVPGFGLTEGLPLSGSFVASYRFGPKPKEVNPVTPQ